MSAFYKIQTKKPEKKTEVCEEHEGIEKLSFPNFC